MTTIDLTNLPAFIKTVKKGDYTIRTVESEYLSNFDLTMRIFRSLITNKNNDIVSIAPAKSLPNDDFFRACREYRGPNASQVRTTEIIEGTMINLFWDTDKWEIATKKSVGCNYHFFRNQYFPGLPELEQKTFKQMFLDGIGQHETVGDFANSLNLSKNRCYSFVMQHPSNHIVVPVVAPAVYLVSCYDIISGENASYKYIDVFTIKSLFSGTNVKFPRFFNDMIDPHAPIELSFLDQENRIYLVGQETNIVDYINNLMQNPLNSYRIPGIMVTHTETGLRTSYTNDKYAEIKLLRGNNPNLHYQYLVLRKIQKDADFIRYFPQYRAHFAKFREHFEACATRIHRLYLNVHVLKITTLDAIEDKRDKYHVEKLHFEHYIPALKLFKAALADEALVKPKVTRKMVIQYLDGENIIAPM